MITMIRTQDIDPVFILYGVLVFSWVEFVWEAYLSIRQRRIYRKHTTPPPELQGIVDDETFEKVSKILQKVGGNVSIINMNV